MASYTRLGLQKRNEVIGVCLNKMLLAQISRNMGILFVTIKRTWYKWFDWNEKQHDLLCSRCPRKMNPQNDQQFYRHFCILNNSLWREIVNINSFGCIQIQQKLAEINLTFKPHHTIWMFCISVTNQWKRDKYVNEYHIYYFKW